MRQWARRDLLRGAAVLGMAGLTAACSKPVQGRAVEIPNPPRPTTAQRSDQLGKARAAGVATILAIDGNQPFSYTDSAGEATGEAVELAKTIYPRLGIAKVSVKFVPFDAALQKLAVVASSGGDIQMVAGGLFANPQRCASLVFVPDYVDLTSLLVPPGNPKHVKTYSEVVSGHLQLGVLAGTPFRAQAQAAGVASVVEVPDIEQAQALLRAGRIDCVVCYHTTLEELASSGQLHGEITAPFQPSGTPPMYGGFFFARTSDTSISDAFATELQKMQRSGEWLTVASRFGLSAANQVPPGTVSAQVCR